LGWGTSETDFVADGIGQSLQNAAVLQQEGLDAGKALAVDAIGLRHAGIDFRNAGEE
jgi:hypothetical protein